MFQFSVNWVSGSSHSFILIFRSVFLGEGVRFVYTFKNACSQFLFIESSLVTRLTRRASLVEHEIITLPEHTSSPPVVSGVRVTRSLVLYACFVDRCLLFCGFSFGHCVVCSSSIYGVCLPLWYFQTLLSLNVYSHVLITCLTGVCII